MEYYGIFKWVSLYIKTLYFIYSLWLLLLFCSDNGFLMMPGVKYSMSFVSWVTVELPTFVADLQIR